MELFVQRRKIVHKQSFKRRNKGKNIIQKQRNRVYNTEIEKCNCSYRNGAECRNRLQNTNKKQYRNKPIEFCVEMRGFWGAKDQAKRKIKLELCRAKLGRTSDGTQGGEGNECVSELRDKGRAEQKAGDQRFINQDSARI